MISAPAPIDKATPADRPPVDFSEVLRLSEAYWSMRDAPQQEIEAVWGPSNGELAVVDIPRTANRCMIGTVRAVRRQDIWIRGGLTDKYGIDWMLTCGKPRAQSPLGGLRDRAAASRTGVNAPFPAASPSLPNCGR